VQWKDVLVLVAVAVVNVANQEHDYIKVAKKIISQNNFKKVN
jgi:hypothetical protein